MSEVKTDKITGVSTAKTVTVTVGASATQSLESGLAKHHVNYDAVAGATDASLNQSSLTDQRTGEFLSTYTNAFTGAQAKTCVMSTTNTSNDGSSILSDTTRGGNSAGMGSLEGSSEHLAASASAIQFYTAYGSTGSHNGDTHDFDNSFCVSFGELT
tara:strand:- start:221 stop:691 length:471 start_codon:yes stop_codon:yes gene_type:complete